MREISVSAGGVQVRGGSGLSPLLLADSVGAVMLVVSVTRGFQIGAFLLSGEVEVGGVREEEPSFPSNSSKLCPNSEDLLLSTVTASLVVWMMEDLVSPLLASVAALSCFTTEIGIPLTGESGDSNNTRSLFFGVTMKGVFVHSCSFILPDELDSLGEGVLASLLVSILSIVLLNTGLGGDMKMLALLMGVARVGEVVAVVVVVMVVAAAVVVMVDALRLPLRYSKLQPRWRLKDTPNQTKQDRREIAVR